MLFINYTTNFSIYRSSNYDNCHVEIEILKKNAKGTKKGLQTEMKTFPFIGITELL
jgi:hypothetical protein